MEDSDSSTSNYNGNLQALPLTGMTGWYNCYLCGSLVAAGIGLPPHICGTIPLIADHGPEECGLCFSMVKRGKMSDHWMNLHHKPMPGVI